MAGRREKAARRRRAGGGGLEKRRRPAGAHASKPPRAQGARTAGAPAKRRPGKSTKVRDGAQAIRDPHNAGAEELYRLVGKIVCVGQEVANKVEMCVASKRNERAREARGAPGDDVGVSAKPAAPFPGQDGAGGVPGSDAGVGKKARYLKYHWREMRKRRRLGVSEEEFAGYVTESGDDRNTVAHSTIVHNGDTLTNVREGIDISAADLEGFLVLTYRARDAINLLCEHMGLDDYAGYVRQRKEASVGGRAARRAGSAAGGGPVAGRAPASRGRAPPIGMGRALVA